MGECDYPPPADHDSLGHHEWVWCHDRDSRRAAKVTSGGAAEVTSGGAPICDTWWGGEDARRAGSVCPDRFGGLVSRADTLLNCYRLEQLREFGGGAVHCL